MLTDDERAALIEAAKALTAYAEHELREGNSHIAPTNKSLAAKLRAIAAPRVATVGELTIDKARAVALAGVRAAIGEVARQTGPGTHTVEGLGAGEREVEWKLKLATRGPIGEG